LTQTQHAATTKQIKMFKASHQLAATEAVTVAWQQHTEQTGTPSLQAQQP